MYKTARIFGVFALLLWGVAASAQPKYWIFLKDKDQGSRPAVSAKTLEQRHLAGLPLYQETDLPLRETYVQHLERMSLRLHHRSRWFNALSASLSPTQLAQVRALPFVTEVVPLDADLVIASTAQAPTIQQMDDVLAQVQAELFREQGLTAKGVTIGVIDAGFYGADSSVVLRHLFSNKRILGIRDYVKPERGGEALFRIADSFNDMHGTEVLAAIGGIDLEEKIQYGAALNATYYLARTDYTLREWRGEEDNWIAAMEWMDSLGVRLINTSLGYAKGFSDPAENYAPRQMDGKTSLISRAAQLAADQKGILLIVSAGNEGDDKKWRIVSTPADTRGVLSIGATNRQLWNRISYSSVGPDFLDYLKPNVSCFSLYGTSLSAPVITGFAACLMQAAPQLTNKELFDLIERSAHLYPYGNTFVGYGVPQASRALALLKAPYLPNQGKRIVTKEKALRVEVATTDTLVVAYRKSSHKDVIAQQAVKVVNGAVELKRQSSETHTTLDYKTGVIEVVWE